MISIKTLSRHHQMMVDDGLPKSLVLTPEERRESWERSPPRPMPKFAEPRRERGKEDAKAVEKFAREEKERADIKFRNRMARAKERSKYAPGAIWDTRTCRWIHPNLPIKQEKREMPNKDGEKTVPEMTAEYNALIMTEAGQKMGLTPIKQFKDRASAVSRLTKVREALKKDMAMKDKVPKKRLPFTHAHGDVVEQFDFKPASEREKLLHLLLDNFEGMVSKSSLGKLAVNAAGIIWRIDNKKLPYELREKVEDGVKFYGLYRKVQS